MDPMTSRDSKCSNIFKKADGSLDILIERRPLYDTCCHTVHLVLACPSAVEYSLRSSTSAVRAWFCGQPTTPSAGTRRCPRHWFSLFVCYAADLQPVAIANTTQQLAELLGVPAVFLLDANSRQLLDANGWMQNNPTATPVKPRAPAAAAKALQAAEGAELLQQQGQAADIEVEPPPPAACYDGDRVILEVPEPQGNWTTSACAALFIVLDVDSTEAFQAGQRYTIMHNCRCGNEAGKQLFCGQHRKAPHIYLLAKNGEFVWARTTLSDLAPVLAVTEVVVQDPLGDLQAKLAMENMVADTASAAATCDGGRSTVERQQVTPAAAPPGPTATASVSHGSPTTLRSHLTSEQVAAAGQQPSSAGLSHLQQGYIDVQLSGGAACCTDSPCLGLNLRLGVSSLQELASSSGPVVVAAGLRCGNAGGTKRCCKQHKSTLIVLTDQQGNLLPGAANFDGLASILKVSSVQMLDSGTLQPLPQYQQLPPSIRWQVSPDGASFRVWMPPDQPQKAAAAAATAQEVPDQPEPVPPEQQTPPQQQQQTAAGVGRQCVGLEFVVALQQGQAHAMGTTLPVLSVTRCGNQGGRGPPSACRHHQGGVLHLLAQGVGGQTLLTTCRNLGELAIWLGVQQVEILDSETGQPIDLYKVLVPTPLQLAMPCQPQQQLSNLAPPILQVQPPQGWNGAAAADAVDGSTASTTSTTAARMDKEQRRPVAQVMSALSVASGTAGQGNCSIQLLPVGDDVGNSNVHIQGYVIGIPSRPAGAAKSNPCRALDVTVSLGGEQTVWTQGQGRCILSHVQRCGNEAGNKSRCKQHNDAAIQLLALLPSNPHQQAAPGEAGLLLGAQLLQQRVPALVARLNSNAALAQQLGVSMLLLKCRDSGEDLGDISNWSLSTATGTAAKVQQQVTTAAPQAPTPVTVVLPQLLQNTLGSTAAVLPPYMQAQQQQQEEEEEAKSGSIMDATTESAAACPSGAPHVSLHQPAAFKANFGSSSSSIIQGLRPCGPFNPVTPIAGFQVQQTAHRDSAPLVLQSCALATSIAAGDGSTATGAYRLPGLDAGFSTSAPLAKLAGMFKAKQPDSS